VIEQLSREDVFVVVHEQVMTDTARLADVVLPATAFLEHRELRRGYGTMRMFDSPAVVPPPGEARSNNQLFGALLERLGLVRDGDAMTDDALVAKTFAASPHGEALRVELQHRGVAFPPGGPRPLPFVDVFPDTPDGKIHLVPLALDREARGLYTFRADPATAEFPLALISPALATQISSTFGQLRNAPAAIEVSVNDAAARDIRTGDRVRVWNAHGEVHCLATVSDELRDGVCLLPKGCGARHAQRPHRERADPAGVRRPRRPGRVQRRPRPDREDLMSRALGLAVVVAGCFSSTSRTVPEAGNCATGSACEAACEAHQDLDACAHASELFFDGKNGHPLDHARSFRNAKRACDKDHALGCSLLGLHYQDGLGVDWNPARAVEVYEQACRHGSGAGCYNLASMYSGGHGVNADFARAAELRKQARTNWQLECDDKPRWCTNLAYSIRDGDDSAAAKQQALVLNERLKHGILVGWLEAARRHQIIIGCLRRGLEGLCKDRSPRRTTAGAAPTRAIAVSLSWREGSVVGGPASRRPQRLRASMIAPRRQTLPSLPSRHFRARPRARERFLPPSNAATAIDRGGHCARRVPDGTRRVVGDPSSLYFSGRGV
jgi:hypothetical protein